MNVNKEKKYMIQWTKKANLQYLHMQSAHA